MDNPTFNPLLDNPWEDSTTAERFGRVFYSQNIGEAYIRTLDERFSNQLRRVDTRQGNLEQVLVSRQEGLEEHLKTQYALLADNHENFLNQIRADHDNFLRHTNEQITSLTAQVQNLVRVFRTSGSDIPLQSPTSQQTSTRNHYGPERNHRTP